jgi:hypothetical protein
VVAPARRVVFAVTSDAAVAGPVVDGASSAATDVLQRLG